MLKLGCDPELFLADAAGALRSSIGLIGGTKAMPSELPLGPGYAVQEDNVAVEFNIPAAESFEQWDDSIQRTIAFLEDFTKEQYGLHFSKLSAALFPDEELQTPQAKEFGCDPDFDAWTGKVNHKPKASDARLRSCGGHIHVGIGKVDHKTAERLGRLMDLYAGVPSVLLDDGELRKQLYGSRGAMRYKPYGMEYRTLSNFWIFDKKTREWAWEVTHQAVDALQRGDDVLDLDKDLLTAINGNNRTVAAQLVKQHGLIVEI